MNIYNFDILNSSRKNAYTNRDKINLYLYRHNIIFCVNESEHRMKHLNVFIISICLCCFANRSSPLYGYLYLRYINIFDILNSHDHAKIYIKINYICIEIKLTYIFMDHNTRVKRLTILYLYAEAISVDLVYNNRDEKLLPHIPMEG